MLFRRCYSAVVFRRCIPPLYSAVVFRCCIPLLYSAIVFRRCRVLPRVSPPAANRRNTATKSGCGLT